MFYSMSAMPIIVRECNWPNTNGWTATRTPSLVVSTAWKPDYIDVNFGCIAARGVVAAVADIESNCMDWILMLIVGEAVELSRIGEDIED